MPDPARRTRICVVGRDDRIRVVSPNTSRRTECFVYCRSGRDNETLESVDGCRKRINFEWTVSCGRAPIGARKKWRFMPCAESELRDHNVYLTKRLNVFDVHNSFTLTMVLHTLEVTVDHS